MFLRNFGVAGWGGGHAPLSSILLLESVRAGQFSNGASRIILTPDQPVAQETGIVLAVSAPTLGRRMVSTPFL